MAFLSELALPLDGFATRPPRLSSFPEYWTHATDICVVGSVILLLISTITIIYRSPHSRLAPLPLFVYLRYFQFCVPRRYWHGCFAIYLYSTYPNSVSPYV